VAEPHFLYATGTPSIVDIFGVGAGHRRPEPVAA
jgi:hypothetical protein